MFYKYDLYPAVVMHYCTVKLELGLYSTPSERVDGRTEKRRDHLRNVRTAY